jgi:putative transposase
MGRTTVPDDWRIPDDFWLLIEPLIPKRVNTHRFGGGRPPAPDRVCMDAIFFVLRTGCQWKALDATKLCPGSTAHDRFQLWVEQGVFLAMWEAGLLLYDELEGIDWAWLSMDGCMTKAPLGGEKDGEKPHRPGQEGGQAKPADRRGRHPGWPRRRRGQPQRHEDGRGHVAEHPHRAAKADQGRAAGDVHGQGVRLRGRA